MGAVLRDVSSPTEDTSATIDKSGYSMLGGVVALAYSAQLSISGPVAFVVGAVAAFVIVLLIETVAGRAEHREYRHD